MKTKRRLILCFLIAFVFLIPILGNSAMGISTTTFYFNNYDTSEAWETNPGNMVDGNNTTYASTTIEGDVQLLNESITDGSNPGTIIKVEIRARAYYEIGARKLTLRPVFGGTTDGCNYSFVPNRGRPNAGWSQWFDITNDPSAPVIWTTDDVINLDCDVDTRDPTGAEESILFCSRVEILVTSL